LSLLAEVVGVLRERGIDHALIGAAAMALHGVSRATVDVDLLTVDVRALETELWTDFSARNVAVRVLKGDTDDPLAGSVRLETRGADIVDVVVGRYKWQREVLEASEPLSIGEIEIPVVRPSGLVVLKLHAGGPKDAWDISSLAETHEQWASIQEEVEAFLDRLPVESRRLWERLRAGT
jgi:predicted nucleotidyltransferase